MSRDLVERRVLRVARPVFIAFLLHPLHRWLTRKLRGRSAASAALLVLLTFVIVIGPLSVLVPLTLRMPSEPPGSLRWAKVIAFVTLMLPVSSSRPVEPIAPPLFCAASRLRAHRGFD